jgi:hypothetical protein
MVLFVWIHQVVSNFFHCVLEMFTYCYWHVSLNFETHTFGSMMMDTFCWGSMRLGMAKFVCSGVLSPHRTFMSSRLATAPSWQMYSTCETHQFNNFFYSLLPTVKPNWASFSWVSHKSSNSSGASASLVGHCATGNRKPQWDKKNKLNYVRGHFSFLAS